MSTDWGYRPADKIMGSPSQHTRTGWKSMATEQVTVTDIDWRRNINEFVADRGRGAVQGPTEAAGDLPRTT